MDDRLNDLARRLEGRQPSLMDNTGRYAVLVPLVEEEDGSLSLLYEVRAATLRRQPGEVCFPGGKMEREESAVECALRETWEELDIPPQDIQVLGQLDFLLHRAGFIMYPILGKISYQSVEKMRPSPAEVGETFRVPLDHLLTHPPMECRYELEPKTEPDFPFEEIGIPRTYRWQRGGETITVYPWENHAIWGLTARITRHLLRLYQGER